MVLFPGCKCCGGSGDEECCQCSNTMLQRDFWSSLTGDYGEDGTIFDSTEFFEVAVEVGWGSEVVWSGVMPSELIETNFDGEYRVQQPTSAVYWYEGSSETYDEPIELDFDMEYRILLFNWGGLRASVTFRCSQDGSTSGETKERYVSVSQLRAMPDERPEGDPCPLNVKSSSNNISGTDKQGNVLSNAECGISVDDLSLDTYYTKESCGLGVVSEVFIQMQRHGTVGEAPCLGFASNPAKIPGQYIKIKLTVKDERLGTISPCYVSNPGDPNALDDGETTGLCNGRPVEGEYCSIRRECDCPSYPPSQIDLYGKDAVFLPGETGTCKCCCFLAGLRTKNLDGDFVINEANEVFSDGSPYDGQPALVFVTDGTDSQFGDEVRVIAIPASRKFGFEIVDSPADGTGYSTLYAEYTPGQCSDSYQWAYYSDVKCSRNNYLSYSGDSEYYPPVYRSQPFNPDGGQSFEEWQEQETLAALSAGCDSPQWDWNWYVSARLFIDEYKNENPFFIEWGAGYSYGEGKTFTDTFNTVAGPLTITGTYSIEQTFDDDCDYAGTCEFPTQTADTITMPVTDEDCCQRGGGSFTPIQTGPNPLP